MSSAPEENEKDGLSWGWKDRSNPETDEERRLKFSLWVSITAAAMFIIAFVALWHVLAAPGSAAALTGVMLSVLFVGVGMTVIAVLTLASRKPDQR